MSSLIVVGDAGVQLVPSARGFSQKTDALLAGLQADVRLDPDSAAARAEISELTRTRRSRILATADTARAEQALNSVARDRNATIRASGMSGLLTTVLALGPALVPVLAGLTGIIVALGSPLLLAGGGLAAFAGVMALAAGESIRIQAAVKRLKTSFAALADSGGGVAAKNVVVKLIDLLASALPKIEPLLKSVATALDDLIPKKAGAGFDKFIKSLSAMTGPSIKGLAALLGNIAQGFGSMAAGASKTGFIEKSLKGMVKATEGFSKIGDSPKFQAFLAYLVENGPLVASALSDIIGAIVHVGVALAPIGGAALTAIQGLANAIKDIPVPVLTALATAFLSYRIGTHAIGGATKAIEGITTAAGAAKSAGRTISGFGQAVSMTLKGTSKEGAAFRTAMSNSWTTVRAKALWAKDGIKTAAVGIGTALKTTLTAFANAGKAALIWAGNVLKAAGIAIMNVVRATAVMVANAAIQIGSWILMGITALINAASIALAWIIAFWPIALIIALVVGLVVVIVKNWDTIKAKTIAIWGAISTWLANAWKSIKSKAASAWDALKTVVTGAIDKLRTGVTTKFNAVLTFVKSIPGKVTGFFSSLGSKMKTIGTNIAQGLLDGVRGAWGKVTDWINDAVNAIPKAVRDALGIHSPSRVFSDIGFNIGAGLVVGMDDSNASIETATNRLITVPVSTARAAEPVSRSSDRPIYMNGSIIGILREIAGQQAELILNDQLAFDGTTGRM